MVLCLKNDTEKDILLSFSGETHILKSRTFCNIHTECACVLFSVAFDMPSRMGRFLGLVPAYCFTLQTSYSAQLTQENAEIVLTEKVLSGNKMENYLCVTGSATGAVLKAADYRVADQAQILPQVQQADKKEQKWNRLGSFVGGLLEFGGVGLLLLFVFILAAVQSNLSIALYTTLVVILIVAAVCLVLYLLARPVLKKLFGRRTEQKGIQYIDYKSYFDSAYIASVVAQNADT